jgi:glycosyltransferase involved in cell wall biosynthesis
MSIKVLVVSSYDDNYNAVRPEGELFIGLQRAGLAVHVITQGHTPFAQRFREAGIRVVDFHPRRKFDPQAIRLIRQELIEQQPHILHLFNNKAITNGILAAWGLPVKVVTYRGYTGNIHWWDPSAYLAHLNPRVDAITCVSEAVREVFLGQPFVSARKAVTVSKGHDPAWYAGIQPADLSNFNLPPNAIVLGSVANARRMKGMPYLAEALRHVSPELPIYLLLIGRGLDTPELRAQLQQTPFADRVRFTGFRTDVLNLIKALDISILPSVKGEGLSKVLLESLFLGRPTIMTDIGGNRGLAIDGQTGLIVPARDPHRLAAAIEQLAANPLLRQQMGPAGARYIAEHFSLSRSITEMKQVYERLASGLPPA